MPDGTTYHKDADRSTDLKGVGVWCLIAGILPNVALFPRVIHESGEQKDNYHRYASIIITLSYTSPQINARVT